MLGRSWDPLLMVAQRGGHAESVNLSLGAELAAVEWGQTSQSPPAPPPKSTGTSFCSLPPSQSAWSKPYCKIQCQQKSPRCVPRTTQCSSAHQELHVVAAVNQTQAGPAGTLPCHCFRSERQTPAPLQHRRLHIAFPPC